MGEDSGPGVTPTFAQRSLSYFGPGPTPERFYSQPPLNAPRSSPPPPLNAGKALLPTPPNAGSRDLPSGGRGASKE